MIASPRQPGALQPGVDERRRTLDFAWPVLLSVVTVFSLAADYLGLTTGDVATLLKAVFVIGVVYLGSVLIGQRLAAATAPDRLRWISPLAFVLALSLMWHFSGTLSNPAFTVFMAVPVLLAGVASYRWLPYLVALAATVALIATSLIDHPEARWFIERWGWSWPTALTVEGGSVRAAEFSELAARPDTFFATFGAGMLATALVASAIGALVERHREGYLQAVALGEESGQLADRLLASGAAPVAILSPGTGTVIAANDAFAACTGAAAVVGRALHQLLSFSRAEALDRILAGDSASLDQVQIVRAGDGERLTRVRLTRLELPHESVLKLKLDDPQPAHYLAMASDQLAIGLIVIDGAQRVAAADRHARALFPGLAPDRPASSALAVPGTGVDWWQIAPRRKLTRRLRVGEREHEVEIVRHRPWGADRALTFISLRAGPR